jgi:type IV pilus assembly protein PilN
MNVEINLLRARKKRPIFTLLVYLLISVLVFGILFFYLTYLNVTSEISSKKNQIATLQQGKLKMLAEMEDLQYVTIIDEYETDVLKIEELHISSVKVLKKFVSLLPERGYFLDYSYSGNGIAKVYVQFDTLPEMSLYTDAMNAIAWVKDVELVNVDIRQIGEKSENVLPRYYVQYAITLNMDEMKDAQTEEERS